MSTSPVMKSRIICPMWVACRIPTTPIKEHQLFKVIYTTPTPTIKRQKTCDVCTPSECASVTPRMLDFPFFATLSPEPVTISSADTHPQELGLVAMQDTTVAAAPLSAPAMGIRMGPASINTHTHTRRPIRASATVMAEGVPGVNRQTLSSCVVRIQTVSILFEKLSLLSRIQQSGAIVSSSTGICYCCP